MVTEIEHPPWHKLESGPMKIGNTTGIFLKSEHAMAYMCILTGIMHRHGKNMDPLSLEIISGLSDLLFQSTDDPESEGDRAEDDAR